MNDYVVIVIGHCAQQTPAWVRWRELLTLLTLACSSIDFRFR
jgi:hypothetical protein